ncbi:pyroglutamyl-peptidase I [uncultured Sneathia sp.]|uniref:pyroglutamyl-peptidase I n=1 Tax=Sneathia vaginalis TaxID=187101 RepID=UPI0028063EB4|nr:pyroglutamyl-peptidase I [uncultured Sneathia sp.]MBE2989722.1 pyroglutamyl-peptidase I [Sneathia sp. DSM 16630]
MKILVTGFDPFGEDKINPAIESVKKLPDEIKGVKIIKLEIPTVYMKSLEKIDEAIKEYNPDVILSIGQAGGRPDITVERVGINVDDYRIKDNEGNQPIDTKIYDDGENAYFSNLPIKAIVENIRKNNIPASISNTAGTFVCNHVLYGVQYLLDKKYPNKKSGFIHIPFLPEQVISRPNTPSMSISTIVKALTLALEAIIENGSDKKISGGTIC